MHGTVEQRSFLYSVLLHVGLLIIAVVGIPHMMSKEEPEPLVMTVDILPITPITNVKPSDQPLTKLQQSKAPPTPVKPVAPPAPTPPKAADQPKPEEEHFNPMDDKPKEEAPPPKPPEPPKTPAESKQFDDILKNLEKESTVKKPDAKDAATTPENTTRSNAPFDPSMQLGLSEKDAIRNQFIKCWRMPAGAKDPHSLAARIRVQLKPDGTLISAELSPDQIGRYNSDTFFRAAADGAIRAVHECTEPPNGPLKNLPTDKYNAWKDMELNFDPAELLD